MTVVSIEGDFLFLEVDQPMGLVNTIFEKIPKKFSKKHIGSSLHRSPKDVTRSRSFENNHLHKFFSTKSSNEDMKEEINQRTLEINKLREEIESFDKEIKKIESSIFIIVQNIDNEDKNKNVLIQTNIELQKRIIEIDNEITTIMASKSPRELKNLLPKIPALKDMLSSYKSEKNDNEKSINILESKIKLSKSDKELMDAKKEKVFKRKEFMQIDLESKIRDLAMIKANFNVNNLIL